MIGEGKKKTEFLPRKIGSPIAQTDRSNENQMTQQSKHFAVFRP